MIYFLGFPLSSDISQPENPLENERGSALLVEHMKYGAGINWDVNSILPQFWSGPPTTPFSFCTWATNNYLSAPTICQCKGQRNSYCALVKKEELLHKVHFFETKRYLSWISLVSVKVRESSQSKMLNASSTFLRQTHRFKIWDMSRELTRCSGKKLWFVVFLKVFCRFLHSTWKVDKDNWNWVQFGGAKSN